MSSRMVVARTNAFPLLTDGDSNGAGARRDEESAAGADHGPRSEMDRLFDRFGSGFGFPPLRPMSHIDPAWRSASSFSFSTPAIDMSEDEKAYKISAELRGKIAADFSKGVPTITLPKTAEAQKPV
jgi:HSP20 family molecular chaperone IbpA